MTAPKPDPFVELPLSAVILADENPVDCFRSSSGMCMLLVGDPDEHVQIVGTAHNVQTLLMRMMDAYMVALMTPTPEVTHDRD